MDDLQIQQPLEATGHGAFVLAQNAADLCHPGPRIDLESSDDSMVNCIEDVGIIHRDLMMAGSLSKRIGQLSQPITWVRLSHRHQP
ncbi:hypothetical protein [Streptomyces cinerochromogenes]|uniref:hypothetical protein n=1 Tax=Streptomyces cinerochromogenes TaxID=66422 RepID=UPI001E4A4A1A|nr:hypothetical protein [Streptomyces cinerochromogenes]